VDGLLLLATTAVDAVAHDDDVDGFDASDSVVDVGVALAEGDNTGKPTTGKPPLGKPPTGTGKLPTGKPPTGKPTTGKPTTGKPPKVGF
jgi:hypothetical protein